MSIVLVGPNSIESVAAVVEYTVYGERVRRAFETIEEALTYIERRSGMTMYTDFRLVTGIFLWDSNVIF